MDDEELFNEGSVWVRKCTCGRRLYQPSSYTNHINGCAVYKSRVGSSLEGARARYKEKKGKGKKGKAALASWFGEGNLDVDAIPASSSQGSSFRDEQVDLVSLTCIGHPLSPLITIQAVYDPGKEE